jgi:hypothetical protein
MVAANPPGPSAYNSVLQALDGSAITSDEDGVNVLAPILTSSGSVIQNIINGAAAQNLQGAPVINQVLIELRILSNLMINQMGATNLDLEQMRADEAYAISLVSGALVP